jgi:hypothetical protein
MKTILISKIIQTPILGLRDGEEILNHLTKNNIKNPKLVINSHMTGRFLPHFKKLLDAALKNKEIDSYEIKLK